jgi:thymidylate kinase
MSRYNKQGRLFIFEGPDGSGKTTISVAFAEYVRTQGMQCDLLAFPGRDRGTLGQLVHELHHDPTVLGINSVTPTSLQLLHIAAHVDAIESRIVPALKSGRTVVLDRFWWSTWVYGKVGGVAENSLKAVIRAERIAWGKVRPTLIFLISRELKEPPATYTQLSEEYSNLAKREERRSRVHRIANDGTVGEALGQVLSSVNDLMHRSNGPVSVPLDSCQPKLSLSKTQSANSAPFLFSRIAPAKPTVVFDTYWKFATKRQDIFFRRVAGQSPPWTTDPVLLEYKFTNAYRASDRVSQYLIKHVIYEGDQSPAEVFFRILLFKLFNRIDTWELLEAEVGTISFSEYSFERYEAILSRAISKGARIYSAAYIMPAGGASSASNKKHQMHLRLLEQMMHDDLPLRLADASSMRQAFELLRSYPTIGDFLAYQYVTDLNYAPITNFSEMEFVVAGPGARDGIRKCFSDLGGLNQTEIIKLVADRQELEFERLGLNFKTLWGRPLQLIDCQNLFCEVDKYARVEHPEIAGITGRTRIKQRFRMHLNPISLWYPPKWGLNERIANEVVNVQSIRRANS